MFNRILNLLYPPICPVCEGRAGPAGGLCPICLGSLLPVEGPRCPGCARPLGRGPALPCPECRSERTSVDRTVLAFEYGGAMSDLIVRMKHGGRPEIVRTMLRLFLERLPSPPEALDALLPVPLFSRAERRRGFNQSRLLAAGLSRAWGLPVRECLVRTRDTGSMRGRDAAERKRAVRGAFRAMPQIASGLRLGLVDDVVASRATSTAAAAALKSAGAARVVVLALAG